MLAATASVTQHIACSPHGAHADTIYEAGERARIPFPNGSETLEGTGV